jgi:hypothetical protein
MNVYMGPNDHGIYFNTNQKSIAYANTPGRFGPWHDTAKGTFLGIPILRMQNINKEKIRMQMKQQSVTPVMLTTTGSNSNVSLLLYITIGNTIRMVAHDSEMDILIAKYLAKLLRHMNATKFDPVMFLEDVLKRIYLHKKKKISSNNKKTWFGMPLDEAKTISKENKVKNLVSQVMSLNKDHSKHRIIVENGLVCIYNTSMCRPTKSNQTTDQDINQDVVIVPIKLLTRKISTPSRMRQLFKRNCVNIKEVIKARYPGSTIVSAEIIKGQKVKLYEKDKEEAPSIVPLRDVLTRVLRHNTLNNLMTRKPLKKKKEKVPRYRYKDLQKISENVLGNMATREGINTTLANDAVDAVRRLVLNLIISQRKEKQQTINTWNAVLEHAPREFYKDVAGALNLQTTKLKSSDKKILILMMQGMTRSDAIKAVKTGKKNNQYWVHNENRNVIVKLPWEQVEKAKSRHNGRVNDNTIAKRIVKHKKDPPSRGFNYDKNRYVYSDGKRKTIPGDDFAQAYRYFAPNNSTFNNNNIVAKAINRYSKQKRFKILRELEEKRLQVEKELIQEYPKKTKRNTMDFASWLLEKAYKIKGSLEQRPLFTGNVGKPGSKYSPWEQYQASLKNTTEDGCKPQKTWPGSGGYSLSMHQSVAYGIIKLRSLGYLQNVPGLFCYYSVGAGKTVISLSSIIAFWNTEKCIIPASVRSNSKEGGNDLRKMAEEATLYFPWFRSDFVGVQTRNGQNFSFHEFPFAHGVEVAEEQLIARLRMGHAIAGHKKATSLGPTNLLNSYTTAYNLIKGKQKDNPGYFEKKARSTRNKSTKDRVQNCIFILDEIQLLFNPPTSEKAYAREYAEFKKILLKRDTKSCFAIALTATPGDTKNEVLDLYSIVMAKEQTGIPPNVTVSAYVTGDTRYFPKTIVKRHCIHLPHAQRKPNSDQNKQHPAEMYTQFYLLRLATRENPEPQKKPEKDNTKKKKATKPEKAMPPRRLIHTNAARAMQVLGILGQNPKTVKAARNQMNVENLTAKGKMRQFFYKHAKESTEYLPITDRTVKKTSPGPNFGNNNMENGSVLQKNSDVMNTLEQYAKNPAYGVVLARTKTWGSAKSPHSRNIFILSPKILRLIHSLVTEDGVHFVYIENNNTLRLVAHILQTVYGWDMYTESVRNNRNDASSLSKNDKLSNQSNKNSSQKTLHPNCNKNESGKNASKSSKKSTNASNKSKASNNAKPRFGFLAKLAVGKTRFLDTRKWRNGNVTDAHFIETVGPTAEDASALMRLIQSNDNTDGKICKVVFATGDNYKGVNTKAVRHLHVVSPMAKWTDLLQLVGRATRFRSHCALDKKDRNVIVHVWSLEPPEELGHTFDILFPDEYVHTHALKVFKKGVGALNKEIVKKSIPVLGNTFAKQQALQDSLSEVCVREFPTIKLNNYTLNNAGNKKP